MTTLAPKLPYTHPFAGGYPRLGGQPLPTDPDAIDYLNRVAAADGAAVEVGVAVAVDDFFKGVKADGIFSAIKAACIMCGARTLSGALVPLVGTAPTNVANNFVSPDYSRTTGLKGDGATKYLDSNRAGDADGQNDKHIGVYITTNPVANGKALAGGYNAAGTAGTQLVVSGGILQASINAATTPSTLQSVVASFAGASREDSSTINWRVSGQQGQLSLNSVAVGPETTYVFGRNFSTPILSDARLAFYSIGSALDLAALDNRVSTLVAAIAAAI